MKLNSPFLILFFLCLLLSCTNKGSVKPTAIETAINTQWDQLKKDTLPSEKLKHAEKAIQLAKQAKDPSLVFRTVVYKLDSAIAVIYPDSIPFYLNRLSSLASKTDNATASSAYILMKRGNYAVELKNYKDAYNFYSESKESFEKQSDSLRAGYNLLRMAAIQQIYNDYSGSEEALTECLAFLEKKKETPADNIREANNMLGISYTGLKDYKEAIRYYKKAKETTDDILSKKIIDNNIALCYVEDSKYKQAIKMFTTLYESEIIKKDSASRAKVTDNLGFSMFKNDGVSGKKLMEEALAIRTRQADEKGMVYSYLNLSEYNQIQNLSLAIDYAQKAYTMATKIGALDNRLKALQLLTMFGDKQYNKEYFRLNDSVTDFRRKAKNEFAKIRYDSTKDRNDMLVSQTQRAEDKVYYLNVGITLITIIFLGIILFISAQIKYKREKRKEGYKTETRIAKKLHDELANDIFNTMTFAEIRDLSAAENKETLLDNLDKIYAQTRNISKENNNIDTNEKYLNNLKEMLSGYSSDTVNIIIKEIEGIDWHNIEPAKKIVVYRVLQELLVNMKKHSKASLVLISFKKINKKVQIDYSDNGVGMGSEEHLIKNGLQNVETRIQSINGTITFDPTPQKGFKVHFSFNS